MDNSEQPLQQFSPNNTAGSPALGPAFINLDDAAYWAHQQIGDKRDAEYGGYIFQRKDQRFVASEPMKSGENTLAYGLFYPTDNRGLSIFPEDHVLQARYGSRKALSMIDSAKVETLNWSRQEADVSAQMFRDEEMREMIFREFPAYLSAAEHSLIMFKPGPTKVQPLLRRLSTKDKPGQIALELESGTIKPSDVVKELAAAGDLRVVISSDLWGAAGNVSAQWAPFPAKKQREVPRQVAFGAIFPVRMKQSRICTPGEAVAMTQSTPPLVSFSSIRTKRNTSRRSSFLSVVSGTNSSL